ncbi:2-hydroxy-3-carboxy-6-oxo-7-methylocta-2,4-dienoate decarboxylase [Mycolicibacterium neoaurum]|uniref:2-amino-3-carboxymuconate-6-semialdehyde decarboxylase n=1 Tax=Mycolicibacterium neoaurum VKM Ac-1815D TaxID=700508 RepID=V5XDR2_MYCNE|nr:2-hydroxy-3-carboxy-6-oxo-7-methylocta-2,4-dienoate decarboxylase [Mycolicibacterium neoaurum VKM Ac-1815D]AMO08425.1 2-hydroxy-3-carboxy-6-oxo-7-methylocta-2,4-dienoate decarboxylase [Mycolicibacterium neoaurum]KJQ51255.1 2-hydroxy-3-carboxy-6-oxo-7-methylocta-2,4-dienoate decarboxylase [Mycolicibacterium neoaurum]KUM08024.1 2-hydroxy-3-carboxy-6-oxo-7-methylocta-2,4-dienoate decarboxylase [Mycolicibacterium neoaurum]
MVPSKTPVVDIHAHVFPDALGNFGTKGDPRWPRLITGSADGQIMCGDRLFRRVQPALWDVETRLRELDDAGVDRQLVSPVPVTLVYWAPADEAASFARSMNDGIAEQVDASHGRLAGLGAVPLQDVDLAIDELTRIVHELKLDGAEIGTVIGGRELDDPALRPFFAAAERLGATLYVHPLDGGEHVIRRSGSPYDFGIGMLTDTAIAATALVFGGVLEEHPTLRIVLAHGCGSYAWTYPRTRTWAQFSGADPSRLDALTRMLWVDSLVFDGDHLPLLVRRFGADHVMVGTDYPFIPGQLRAAPALVRDAADDGLIRHEVADGILSGNAETLLHRCH